MFYGNKNLKISYREMPLPQQATTRIGKAHFAKRTRGGTDELASAFPISTKARVSWFGVHAPRMTAMGTPSTRV
jgi:hypothetical protein